LGTEVNGGGVAEIVVELQINRSVTADEESPRVHLPTVVRIVEKSLRHPSRAVRNGIRVIRHALLDLEEERQKLFAFLQDRFDADTDALRREFEASEFAAWTKTRRVALAEFSGPYRFGSTGEWDCEALYYLVRALKPRVAVETGVCYGASTSYILEALARNGGGRLYSIDLGNSPEEPPNDFFVFPEHKINWELIIGDSKVELPLLLERLGKIDLFHHDSLHTYEHMMWEYQTAFPHLDVTGALSSDDVNVILKLSQPFQRSPFVDFCEHHGWSWRTVSNFGLTVNSSPRIAQLRRQRIHGRPAAQASSASHTLNRRRRPL